MSLKIDSRQLYLQVIDQLKQDIESGKYKPKQKLPSEFQLSKELGVSRATLREALRILEEENIVTRKHGVGTFVNPKPIFSSGIEQLNSVTYMIKESGKTPGSQFLTTEFLKPTADERQKFAPRELESIVKIERVRTADDEPVVFCIDKLPEGLVPVDRVHQTDSLFRLMEAYSGNRIAYAITYIEPVSYHDRIYEILKCDPEQSLLLLKQMHYTAEDEPVLYSVNFFRSDMFSFHVLRKR
ncbi:GntR family transcriptional regulator [Lentibacillus cibarius]|uniref:GntR family transcriptional regulator n=1 Tax=Lentibacillus cibarius TaxID=2583219 RepID=A0A549YKR2_9BACI|nr:GntR family transcriptional regulator [Lentibacillus cibarius]TRM12453.1 GntR family transcriptional regulator [Lentibacillus cibarius]